MEGGEGSERKRGEMVAREEWKGGERGRGQEDRWGKQMGERMEKGRRKERKDEVCGRRIKRLGRKNKW